MKKDDRDKSMQREFNKLNREITNLKEKMKVYEKRLEFTQDEMTKIAVAEQSLIAAVKVVYDIGIKIAERENIAREMGLNPKNPQIATEKHTGGIG